MNNWLRCLVPLFLCAGVAPAVDFGGLQPQGYVSDFSGAIDPAAKAQLERYCAAVEKSTGAQIALVTIPTLEGEPVEDVANTLFRKWGIGKKGTNEGILLLLVTRDHRSRLEVGYGLEPILPDGFSGGLLRQLRPALRANQISDAMMQAAQIIGSRIAAAKGVALDTNMARPRHVRGQEAPMPWWVIAGGLLLLFVLLRGGGGGGGLASFLPGLLLGNIMGRSSYGGRDGGGFGGSDSGGGFGGFGGGDSGGGGASSDW
jgi:uncharacterized protein